MKNPCTDPSIWLIALTEAGMAVVLLNDGRVQSRKFGMGSVYRTLLSYQFVGEERVFSGLHFHTR